MGFASGKYGDIRFTLHSDDKRSEVIEDPINWDDSDREYTRNKEFKGIFSKLSNNLEFTKTGFEYLVDLYRSFGVNSNVRLTKEAKNPRDEGEQWEIIEEGFPNLSSLSWNEQNEVAKIKFDEEEFWLRINNRKGEKYDLVPEVTPDGINLGPLPTRTLQTNGRDIFLRSELRINPDFRDEFIFTTGVASGNPQFVNKSMPLSIITNSDQENITAIFDSALPDGFIGNNGNVESIFFLNSDRVKRNIKFNINFDFTLSNYEAGTTLQPNIVNFYLRKYVGEDALTFSSDVPLLNIPSPQNRIGESFSINTTHVTNINEGDSFALIIEISGNYGITDVKRLTLTNLSGSLVVEEDSVFESSQHEILLPHEKFERLTTILTGKQNAFYSEYFGRTDLGYATNGPGAYIACASGYMVREFPFIINAGTDEEKQIQYDTSFRDLYESYNSITPLAAFLEGRGNQRRLRVEPIEFIYQKFLAIELKRNDQFLQVTDLERRVDETKIYSNIEIGSEKGAFEYEEAFGLDEYNGLSQFRTVINKVENTYKAVSKYRKDSYGHEFARRKPYSSDPEEDTRYDEDIFMLDCKVVGGFLALKLWADDFESRPTGVYSPDTAFNLNLSPGNTLINHSIIINAGLLKYPSDFINFTSSNGNSNLSTKKAGRDAIAENGRISNSQLRRPLFLPEVLEFEIPMNNELITLIEGVNEFNVPNVYGYMMFQTRFGLESVYIDSVKTSDNGKFTCVKAWL